MTGSRRRRQAADHRRGSASGARTRPITDNADKPHQGDSLLDKLDRLAERLAVLEASVAAAEALENETRRGYQALAVELMAQLADARRAAQPPVQGRRSLFRKPERTVNPLFDAAFYLRQAPQLEAGESPEAHYCRTGWREGLRPHPLFDPTWYLAQYPDVAAAGLEPLTHYLERGAAEGRSPSPWFDVAAYRALRGEALPSHANPLLDYLQGGAWRSFPPPQDPELLLRLAREDLTPLQYWAALEMDAPAESPPPASDSR